jgi:hypothetical protein
LVTEFKSLYEKGLEAEKLQLPFFLPYESNIKSFLEYNLKFFEDRKSLKQQNSSESSFNQIETLDRKSQLTDPNRIEIIKAHRQISVKIFDFRVGYKFSRSALKIQKASKSISGLKKITLRDMDPTKDHIYEGFVMQITFIEDSVTECSLILNVIEDQNGDTQRCFIFNFEHENNDSIVQQTYGFGHRMSLINPYMQIAYDSKPVIRIDDPKSLVKFGGEEKIDGMCRYCCKANAKKVCSRCKRSRYCDRICQTNDWKLYEHKLICINPLNQL